MLQVKNLCVSFSEPHTFFRRKPTLIVDDVSFNIEQGNSVGLVGESGSGKTTILRTIMGITKITQGKILFNGQEIQHKNKQYRKDVQMIFQNVNTTLNPKHRIGELISEPLLNFEKQSNVERQYRVDWLLNLVGLSPEYALRYPHELSGGQRQRVVIARALAPKPKLIVADEPVSALDVSVQAQILNCMKDIQDECNLSCLFVSHDLNVVSHMCDEVLIIHNGRIVESGKASDVMTNPANLYTKQLLSAIPSGCKSEVEGVASQFEVRKEM